MSRAWRALLPELRRLPEAEREEALRIARTMSLDKIELVGMAVGLVAVTALTRYTVPDAAMAPRFAMAVLNFVVAVPLLVVALGPFHIRRLRRGLREQLERRRMP